MNNHLFKNQIINIRLYLEPKQLNKNYQETLYDLVCDKIEKKCKKNYGYINKVISIKECVYEEIMKMIPNVYFLMQVNIETYMPSIGDKIKINIEFIFNHGIFGSFEKIKVLIPIQNCSNYSLKQEFSQLILANNKNQKNIIKKDDIIEIEITNVRFEKENFSCLGKI